MFSLLLLLFVILLDRNEMLAKEHVPAIHLACCMLLLELLLHHDATLYPLTVLPIRPRRISQINAASLMCAL